MDPVQVNKDVGKDVVDSARPLHNAKVLAVIAHPDDEAYFSTTIFKLAHEQNAQVDLLVITNGEGGYNYSALAGQIYGKDLSTEAKARQALPDIREAELHRAGEILGVSGYTFLRQKDEKVSSVREVFESGNWDTVKVRGAIDQALSKGQYDVVLTLLPGAEQHGAHSAATLLALDGVQKLPPDARPIVLSASLAKNCSDAPLEFTELSGYPNTRLSPDAPTLDIDRTKKFGCNGELNYQIVAEWHMAEHRSQGKAQQFIEENQCERLRIVALTPEAKIPRTKILFDALSTLPNAACPTPTEKPK